MAKKEVRKKSKMDRSAEDETNTKTFSKKTSKTEDMPMQGHSKKTNFLMGLDFRNPKNISVGNNSVVNKNVLLDGRGGKLVIGNNVDIAQEGGPRAVLEL